MTPSGDLPRLLIVDDVFGRTVLNSINQERRALCGKYLMEDITGDEEPGASRQRIRHPLAQVVFCRGQTPGRATVGDTVENDLQSVIDIVQRGWSSLVAGHSCWSLVLLDLCFYTGRVTQASDTRSPGMPQGRQSDDDPGGYYGLKILAALRESFPDLPVVILSSKPREAVSLAFSTLGALGFIDRSSPRSPGLLREYLWRHGLIPDASGSLVGKSKALLFTLRSARRACVSRRNLLLKGERGTGKELLATYIHQQTYAGENRPFVPVDSGTLDGQLYSSALFGHRRGAYTGADRDRQGLIEDADGGDLFLDEIGNMPLEVQAGLLRVLEERKVIPLGAGEGRSVDTRFLSATNEDIEGRAASGAFRPDLLDRLRQGGTLALPPLRERLEDLPVLVERFVRQAEASVPGALPREIDASALGALAEGAWLGNIRELRDCLFAAVAQHPDVEFLVSAHLILADSAARRWTGGNTAEQARAIPPPREPLEELGHQLESFDFRGLPREALSGKLPGLHRAYARFIARYVGVILEQTRRPTPQNPPGEVMIHPAMKLLTGDARLTAAQASDLIKRLLRLDPAAVTDLLTDPVLHGAYERALRLRPGRRVQSKV